ncbi:hypothetical protein WA556_003202, partial [Blastocystis sp. ATCC 50177/Nand II]
FPFKAETIKTLQSNGITNSAELSALYPLINSVSFLSTEEKNEISAYYIEKTKHEGNLFDALQQLKAVQCYWRDIPSFSSSINTALHGGLKEGTITELSGRGSTGKTQFGMMMCATVQLQNTAYVQNQAIFIDTENTFSALRQDELLKRTKNQYASLGNVFVWKIPSLELFLQLLDSLPLFLSSHPNIRLIVIDSIAYPFRQFTDMIERSVKLSAAIRALTSLASQHMLAILVTNHITSFTPDSESPLNTTQIIQPLLGPVWWHAVTNQLLLTMSMDGRRELRVQKSSYLPSTQIPFR